MGGVWGSGAENVADSVTDPPLHRQLLMIKVDENRDSLCLLVLVLISSSQCSHSSKASS